jgi:hypothetical protein
MCVGLENRAAEEDMMRLNRLFAAGLVLLGALCTIPNTYAAVAGVIQHLSGTLSVQKPDGTVKILSQKSEVETGDILTTEKDTYAQINFTDGSQATLRPNSKLKITTYQFKQDAPNNDNLVFSLLKGGLRTVTGLIGKRGNQDAYKISTSTATIGIRGSSGDTLECSAGCAGVTNTSDQLPPGVYHTTYSGAYIMQNPAGSQLIGEGQFGYARDINTPPILIPPPANLNLNQFPFTLGISGGAISGGPGNKECVVR